MSQGAGWAAFASWGATRCLSSSTACAGWRGRPCPRAPRGFRGEPQAAKICDFLCFLQGFGLSNIFERFRASDAPRRPKRLQTAPRRPKRPPRLPEEGPRGLQENPRRPKRARRRRQWRPRRPERAREPPELPRRPERPPRSSQDSRRGSQDGPRGPRDGPRGPQDGPRGPRTAPRGTQRGYPTRHFNPSAPRTQQAPRKPQEAPDSPLPRRPEALLAIPKLPERRGDERPS